MLSFLYKMETNLIENLNKGSFVTHWVRSQLASYATCAWLLNGDATCYIQYTVRKVLWLRSRNEPTVAAPALIRKENSVCSISLLSPSFLPVASTDDDINNRFEKENKGFMTLVLINTLEQNACKASGAIKAGVLALSEMTFFLSMFKDCLELAGAHGCDCLY